MSKQNQVICIKECISHISTFMKEEKLKEKISLNSANNRMGIIYTDIEDIWTYEYVITFFIEGNSCFLETSVNLLEKKGRFWELWKNIKGKNPLSGDFYTITHMKLADYIRSSSKLVMHIDENQPSKIELGFKDCTSIEIAKQLYKVYYKAFKIFKNETNSLAKIDVLVNDIILRNNEYSKDLRLVHFELSPSQCRIGMMAAYLNKNPRLNEILSIYKKYIDENEGRVIKALVKFYNYMMDNPQADLSHKY